MEKGRRLLLGSLLGGVAAAVMLRTPARAQSVQYTYDALGRLSTATYPSGVVTRYSYDAAGNRTEVYSGTNPPPPPPPPPAPPPAPPGALAATVSAATWFSSAASEDAPVVASATGGTPPYAYVWQKVSGNPGTYSTNPSSNFGSWYFSGSGISPVKVSTWRCQVTDASSASTFTPNVEVTIDVS